MITKTENNMRKTYIFNTKNKQFNHSSCLFHNRLNFTEHISF